MGEKEEIFRIAELLKDHKNILYPTDTIAGVGCDATSDVAVEKVRQLKNRDENKSFIILVNSDAMLNKYVPEIPEIAWDLIDVSDRPLTIVFPKGINLSPLVINKDGSVAVRMVKDGFCSKLIQRFGKPIVSTSANLQSEPSPSSLDDVSPQIKEAVDYIVPQEFWKKTGQKASSIIQLNGKGQVKILRK